MPMVDRRRFAELMAELAKFHGKDLDVETLTTYWEALSPRITDAQFALACEALKSGEWWPSPARVLRAVDVACGFGLALGLNRLYEDVRACDEPGPTGGTVYRLSTIRRRCGEVAAELVEAVGGVSALLAALRSENDEWLRKAFLEAGRELYRSRPEVLEPLLRARGALMPAATSEERPALAPPQPSGGAADWDDVL